MQPYTQSADDTDRFFTEIPLFFLITYNLYNAIIIMSQLSKKSADETFVQVKEKYYFLDIHQHIQHVNKITLTFFKEI